MASINRERSESLLSRLNDTDLVLEVGSGSSPWIRSDVMVDRFLVDEVGQRGRAELFRDRRPIIVAAGEKLPFKDKVFDFIYCNHVVEHAEDIGAMFSEMSRVGKAGFIECPNPLLERVLDQEQHNWYIANLNGKLFVTRKTYDSNVTTEYDRFYFHMMSDHFIIRNYWNHFVSRLEWKDQIQYEICDDVNRVFSETINVADAKKIIEENLEIVLRSAWKDALIEKLKNKIKATPFSAIIKNAFNNIRNRRKSSKRVRITNVELEKILACPYCRSDLKKNEGAYVCTNCNRKYPMSGDVPVFL